MSELESFYEMGARFPIPDIEERTLGLVSGSLHQSVEALRRGPVGAILSTFTAAPTFTNKLIQDIGAGFYDELAEEGIIRKDQQDAVHAGIETVWTIYFQNSPGLEVNISKLEDPADLDILDRMMHSRDFEHLSQIPDIPESHPHLRTLVESLSQTYSPSAETAERYQQGARIGFWLLQSFWYKLDPARHRPGRD